HEHIVVIHEVNEVAGVPFMVLEFLEGQSLRDVVGPRPLPPNRVVELVTPVVKALVRAHAVGVVHRDLKPENIFPTSWGTVKVLDFGIAKLFADRNDEVRPRPADALSSAKPKLATQEGAIVGTMPYMSPEQWGMGGSVDHRSDLYAVGVILYEMLTG